MKFRACFYGLTLIKAIYRFIKEKRGMHKYAHTNPRRHKLLIHAKHCESHTHNNADRRTHSQAHTHTLKGSRARTHTNPHIHTPTGSRALALTDIGYDAARNPPPPPPPNPMYILQSLKKKIKDQPDVGLHSQSIRTTIFAKSVGIQNDSARSHLSTKSVSARSALRLFWRSC